MKDDTVDNRSSDSNVTPLRQSTPCSEPSSLLAAQRDATPLDRGAAINELGRCLTLCAPSGMSSDERAVWLTAAWAEVSDMPASAFLDACAVARRTVEHPAKLVPTIIREGREWGDLLRRRYERERAQWENRNAPRLTVELSPEPWEADRDEVKDMMASLVSQLRTGAPRE